MKRTKRKMKRSNTPNKTGLGDVIETITTKTGIKKAVEVFSDKTGIDCGCDKRKEKLNKLFSWTNPECMTKEQFDLWTDTRATIDKTSEVSKEAQETIVKLVREIHKMSVSRGKCKSCSGAVWLKYIQMIDKVYDTYKEEMEIVQNPD